MDRFKFYDHTKIYTAAPPDVLRVDEKHLREHYVFNVLGFIITTNHKTDGIYLPADDRRHYVAWSDATKEDFTPDYWTSIYRWFRGSRSQVARSVITFICESHLWVSVNGSIGRLIQTVVPSLAAELSPVKGRR